MNFSQISRMVMVLGCLSVCGCNEGAKTGEAIGTASEPVVGGEQAGEGRPEAAKGKADSARADLAKSGFAAQGFAKLFADADKDGDGRLTEAEVRAAAEAKFRAADTNGDGFLDEAEAKQMFVAHEAEFMASLDDATRERFAEMKRTWENGPKGPPGHKGHPEHKGPPGPPGGPGAPGAMNPMARIDTDGDGKVSMAEFVNTHVEMFKRMDPGGTGSVSLEDLQSGFGRMRGPGGPGHPGMPGLEEMQQKMAKRFAQLDRNGDGKLTKDKFEAYNKAQFAEADANKDGVVDDAELASHKASNAGGPGKGFRALRMAAEGNGRVTLADFLAAQQKWFDVVDANSDGVITLDEMQAHRPKRGPSHAH